VRRRFSQVDVFTELPYFGNPLAVVIDGEGVRDELMGRFARWTNLSETTFLVTPTTPEADYRVRIWTPKGELPFAGHPTLGSCHAWLQSGRTPHAPDVIVQECGLGLVEILRSPNGELAFAAPPFIRFGEVDEAEIVETARQLRIPRSSILDAHWVDNGPGWLAVMLSSAEAVLALHPTAVERSIGVVGMYPPGSTHAYEVRAFMSVSGRVIEDPVTGSLNAGLAQWLIGTGMVPTQYTATQGAMVGRAGVAKIRQSEDGRIWVGGHVVTAVTGTVEL
jgi:PhzF family phenazine biosynthesis protein